MQRLTILGWKAGVEAQPLELLRLLRETLGFDLPQAKKLLDTFAENGELGLLMIDAVQAARFGDLALRAGLSISIVDD